MRSVLVEVHVFGPSNGAQVSAMADQITKKTCRWETAAFGWLPETSFLRDLRRPSGGEAIANRRRL